MIFAPRDLQHLICDDVKWFDIDALHVDHGRWSRHCVRNSLVIELLAQLDQEGADFLFKGGSLLQTRLNWPPARASIDLDIESNDVPQVKEALDVIVDRFSGSELVIEDLNTRLPGKQFQIRFPRHTTQAPAGFATRVDVVESTGWKGDRSDFEFPPPWSRSNPVPAPSEEVQAAQKALMMADPPYGRDVENNDLNRKSRIKDIYDLLCLGRVPLDGGSIINSASDEVDHEARIFQAGYRLKNLIAEAKQNLIEYIPPRPINIAHPIVSHWRAYSHVNQTIRDEFPQEKLRMAAGCIWHVLDGIDKEELDWEDVWRPIDREPREAWSNATQIDTIAEPVGGFQEIAGLREAWALPKPL